MSGFDRDFFSRSLVTPVNTAIIVANILVFLWMMATGDVSSTSYMHEHGADFWPDVVFRHEYYRLLTSAFIHFSLSHIFNNMLVLAFIGDNLERALGSLRYAIFYFIAVLGSGISSVAWNMYNGSMSISGGASGAVSAVVGGILIVLIMNKGRFEDLSASRVALFAAASVYYGMSTAGIDNAAHIGGFITGALLAVIMYKPRRKRY